MPTGYIRLTNTFIDKEIPKVDSAKYRLTYADTEVKGLRLRVSTNSKTFFLRRRLKFGEPVMLTIGDYPAWSVDQARIEARRLITLLDKGENPALLLKEKRKHEKTKSITLQEALYGYLEKNKLNIKKTTWQKIYKYPIEKYLGDWLETPLSDISKQMVRERYLNLVSRDGKFHTSASVLFRSLRAIFNAYKLPNPVVGEDGLRTIKKSWHRAPAKTRILLTKELEGFYRFLVGQVQTHEDSQYKQVVPLALLFILFTGCRRTEAFTLEWSDFNAKNETIRFRQTKAGGSRTIPLSQFLYKLLEKLKSISRGSEWLFPGPDPKNHIAEPKNTIQLLMEKEGIEKFSTHDLRRTFISHGATVANEHIDHIVGHKVQTVSFINYRPPNIELLKPSMEKITMMFLEKCKGSVEDIK